MGSASAKMAAGNAPGIWSQLPCEAACLRAFLAVGMLVVLLRLCCNMYTCSISASTCTDCEEVASLFVSEQRLRPVADSGRDLRLRRRNSCRCSARGKNPAFKDQPVSVDLITQRRHAHAVSVAAKRCRVRACRPPVGRCSVVPQLFFETAARPVAAAGARAYSPCNARAARSDVWVCVYGKRRS
jgi:hypothetical protein